MKGSYILLIALIAAQFYESHAAGADTDWGYSGSIAPQFWKNSYSSCGGTHQSPINIDLKTARYDKFLKPFHYYYNESTKSNYTISNRGNNAVIYFGSTIWKADIVGYTGYCYEILQMHFHWGSDNSRGSEHTVNGKMYPLESHWVMWNCRDHKTFDQAVTGVNGLAVVGIFYELDDSATPNKVLDQMINILKRPDMKICNNSCQNLTTDVAEAHMPFFHIDDLLPPVRTKFFRYKGSLTTPPCTENVLWSVFNTTLKVTSAQMEVLRSLKYAADPKTGVVAPMVNNYRPVLPLNPEDPANAFRFVAASFKEGIGGASSISISSSMILFAVVILLINRIYN